MGKKVLETLFMNTNREEKSLRYIAMVAEFLDDNKLEMFLKK